MTYTRFYDTTMLHFHFIRLLFPGEIRSLFSPDEGKSETGIEGSNDCNSNRFAPCVRTRETTVCTYRNTKIAITGAII